MQKEIKVSFYADVDEKRFDDVFKAISKYGAEIITNELSELSNVGCFDVDVMREKGGKLE